MQALRQATSASKELVIGMIPGDGIGRVVLPVSTAMVCEQAAETRASHRPLSEYWKPSRALLARRCPSRRLSNFKLVLNISKRPVSHCRQRPCKRSKMTALQWPCSEQCPRPAIASKATRAPSSNCEKSSDCLQMCDLSRASVPIRDKSR